MTGRSLTSMFIRPCNAAFSTLGLFVAAYSFNSF